MDSDSPWNQAVVRAIKDPAFKARLMSDPAAALKEAGVATPAGVRINVIENTDAVINLVLPWHPNPGAVTDVELERAVGGVANTKVACTGVATGCRDVTPNTV